MSSFSGILSNGPESLPEKVSRDFAVNALTSILLLTINQLYRFTGRKELSQTTETIHGSHK